MRKVLFLTAVLAFVFTSSVWAADISGKWTLKMSGRQGEESFPIVIRTADEDLTVTAIHPALATMEGTGTIKGDAVNFNLKIGGEMQVEFILTGKVTGDKMTGTREVKISAGSGGPGEPPPGEATGAPGGQGGAPARGAPTGQQAPARQQAPAGGQGGAPDGGKLGDWGQAASNAWTAEKN